MSGIFFGCLNAVAYPAADAIAHDNTIIGDGAVAINTDNDNDSLIDKYFRSIVPGILVGGGSGVASAFFDHIFPGVWWLTWLIAYHERVNLINNIGHDMHNHKVSHSKSLMDLTSFLSAWIVYHYAYQEMHGSAPFKDLI